MATTRRLAPASTRLHDRSQGLSDRIRNSGGQLFDASKNYGGRANGTSGPWPNFLYRWIDTVQINPAHEQPRMVYNSGAQPIIRWGYRRFVRTFMAAAPRFYGRWFYAGVQINQFVARGRMTGVTTRQGTTYQYPRFQTGPRAVQLGQK